MRTCSSSGGITSPPAPAIYSFRSRNIPYLCTNAGEKLCQCSRGWLRPMHPVGYKLHTSSLSRTPMVGSRVSVCVWSVYVDFMLTRTLSKAVVVAEANLGDVVARILVAVWLLPDPSTDNRTSNNSATDHVEGCAIYSVVARQSIPNPRICSTYFPQQQQQQNHTYTRRVYSAVSCL